MFGPSGIWTMAPLRYAAKFDPFLSLDCAPTPSTLAQSKERKGSNFGIWQPCNQDQTMVFGFTTEPDVPVLVTVSCEEEEKAFLEAQPAGFKANT